MAKMIATKPHTYGGKTIAAGEEFEVEDAYAGTLQSLGRATLKDAPTKTRPMKAQAAENKPHGQAGAEHRTTEGGLLRRGKAARAAAPGEGGAAAPGEAEAGNKGRYPTRQMKADE